MAHLEQACVAVIHAAEEGDAEAVIVLRLLNLENTMTYSCRCS